MVQALETGDPRQVGRYRLVGRIGQGGMGQVFLGQSPGGRMVAVKLIRADLAGDAGFRARFAREVATARTVSGIFTVPVVDADVDGPQPWLVTAFVDGPSLADAVAAEGPLQKGPALMLAAGLAEGLEVIHAAQVVHRDLKPSNVLLAADGPRIIDFGISQAADGTGLTRTGWVTGSPGFMSPEQAEGRPAGPASDVFSLGSVLAFAATGQEPFGDGSAPALLYRVVHAEPDLSTLPGWIRPVVERCLAKDPDHRPTAGQIVAELGAARPEAGWLPPGPRTEVALLPPGGGFQPDAAATPAGAAGPGPQQAFPPTLTAARPAGPVPPAGTLPPLGTVPSRRRRPLAWAGAGAVVAGLAVATLILRWNSQAAPNRSVAAAQPSHTSSAAASPASPAATGTPASPAPTATSAVPGWTDYRDPSGFTIGLPPGWALSTRSAGKVTFAGPQTGYVIVVEWNHDPRPDALADWRNQSAARARVEPAYRQISIRRVAYRGWNTADWEFTNGYNGQVTHVLDRGFIVTPGQLGYAIELYGPAGGWSPVRASIWAHLVRTFSPGS
jgi:hypothetical protein